MFWNSLFQIEVDSTGKLTGLVSAVDLLSIDTIGFDTLNFIACYYMVFAFYVIT